MTDYTLLPEFDKHQKIITICENNPVYIRGFIAVHRGNHNTPAFGATRYWEYQNEEQALRDALKLSRLMSYKSALAGLRYGGAKGVIICQTQSLDTKRKILQQYIKQVNALQGGFITGADVGIDESDVEYMASLSPYICGISSKPVPYTALGLLYSVEVCLDEVFHNRNIEGRTIAIQGAGKVGSELVRLIYDRAKDIYVSELDPVRRSLLQKHYPKVYIVAPEEIFVQEVDIFSPCGLGGVLDEQTAKMLKCKIIVGGANNQLTDETVGEKLLDAGILYGPDYVVNAGGLISVVDEHENKNYDEARIKARMAIIKQNLKNILERSKAERRPTNIIANESAEKIFNNT